MSSDNTLNWMTSIQMSISRRPYVKITGWMLHLRNVKTEFHLFIRIEIIHPICKLRCKQTIVSIFLNSSVFQPKSPNSCQMTLGAPGGWDRNTKHYITPLLDGSHKVEAVLLKKWMLDFHFASVNDCRWQVIIKHIFE